MARDALCYGAHLDRVAQQFLQGSHSVTANAARNDQLKVIQIGGDVERETVHGHPARDANANSRELFLAHPYAIATAWFRLHPEIARRADQHFLNIAYVAAYVLTPGRQLDDRISDQLSGAMIGNIASATGFKKLDA